MTETLSNDLRGGVPPQVLRDRLLRLAAVEQLCGLRRSAIYALMRQGKFPGSVRLGTKSVAWSETAVLGWVQARISESAEGGA